MCRSRERSRRALVTQLKSPATSRESRSSGGLASGSFVISWIRCCTSLKKVDLSTLGACMLMMEDMASRFWT